LDALIYALYSGARFIFAGTPSGISLSPEGGAHQSLITPSIGMELPNLRTFELCFAREVEWTFLDGLKDCFNRQKGQAMYLRLSTRPVDQKLIKPALERLGEARLRQQVLDGGYRLRDWREGGADVDVRYMVHIVASGALVPEACAAAELLWEEGVAANVINLTSPKRLFEAWKAQRTWAASGSPFDWLIPAIERKAPIVTVQDGASHSLAWLGSVFGAPVRALGVDAFGQSGLRSDLYKHYGIDEASIAEAAFSLLDETVL